MLKRLSIKDFRLLRDVTIDVEPGKPVVLMGPNSSGKSSVLQALDLLGRAAREGFEGALNAFGDRSVLSTANSAHGTTVDVVFERTREWCGDDLDFRYGVAFDSHRILEERLHRRPGADPWSEILSRTAKKLWATNAKSGSRDEQVLSASMQTQLSFELLKHGSFYPDLGTLQVLLAELVIYDGFLTAPAWIRDPREGRLSLFDSTTLLPTPRVDRRGLDLLNALYHLLSNHPDLWDELFYAFRAEFPFVQRLEFPADPAGGKIALVWRDRRYPGVRMQGHQMSEGMTAYLCLLAAILSPEPATALVFDEPDSHLHPSALRRIAHLLEAASEKTAVFVATHSDRFLDHLSDPAGSIHVCEPSEAGVSIRKLDREVLDEWRRDYSLSEFRDRGQIDPGNSSAAE